jgi:hypothetical protein
MSYCIVCLEEVRKTEYFDILAEQKGLLSSFDSWVFMTMFQSRKCLECRHEQPLNPQSFH